VSETKGAASLGSPLPRLAIVIRVKRSLVHCFSQLRQSAFVRALESGQLAGYAGDVWFPQPPPKDHPWRAMPHHTMTPHLSGTTLSAQARYAAGTREILECWFGGQPIRDEYLIVEGGKLAGNGPRSYTVSAAARELAAGRK
jgi:formate dehydrogenase